MVNTMALPNMIKPFTMLTYMPVLSQQDLVRLLLAARFMLHRSSRSRDKFDFPQIASHFPLPSRDTEIPHLRRTN